MTMTEAWCRTYTRLIPADEAERRRMEITSHVHEAQEHGVPRSWLGVETVLGATADLRWSAAVRRGRGLPPLWVVPLTDSSVGAIAGGVLILIAFVFATVEEFLTAWPVLVFKYAALLVACSGHAVTVARRRRR